MLDLTHLRTLIISNVFQTVGLLRVIKFPSYSTRTQDQGNVFLHRPYHICLMGPTKIQNGHVEDKFSGNHLNNYSYFTDSYIYESIFHGNICFLLQNFSSVYCYQRPPTGHSDDTVTKETGASKAQLHHPEIIFVC